MLQISVDIATIILLCCAGLGALTFHRRITLLREALAEAGQILPKLDGAVARMNEASAGFCGRIQAEMQAVEAKVDGAKRLGSDLSALLREAEDMLGRMEQQVRQAKRLDQTRAKPVPRELVEPKGFAEHIERRGAAIMDAIEADAATLPKLQAISSERVELPVLEQNRLDHIRSGRESSSQTKIERYQPVSGQADTALDTDLVQERVSRFAVRRETVLESEPVRTQMTTSMPSRPVSSSSPDASPLEQMPVAVEKTQPTATMPQAINAKPPPTLQSNPVRDRLSLLSASSFGSFSSVEP